MTTDMLAPLTSVLPVPRREGTTVPKSTKNQTQAPSVTDFRPRGWRGASVMGRGGDGTYALFPVNAPEIVLPMRYMMRAAKEGSQIRDATNPKHVALMADYAGQPPAKLDADHDAPSTRQWTAVEVTPVPTGERITFEKKVWDVHIFYLSDGNHRHEGASKRGWKALRTICQPPVADTGDPVLNMGYVLVNAGAANLAHDGQQLSASERDKLVDWLEKVFPQETSAQKAERVNWTVEAYTRYAGIHALVRYEGDYPMSGVAGSKEGKTEKKAIPFAQRADIYRNLADSPAAGLMTSFAQASAANHLSQADNRKWISALKGEQSPTRKEPTKFLQHANNPGSFEFALRKAIAAETAPKARVPAEDAASHKAVNRISDFVRICVDAHGQANGGGLGEPPKLANITPEELAEYIRELPATVREFPIRALFGRQSILALLDNAARIYAARRDADRQEKLATVKVRPPDVTPVEASATTVGRAMLQAQAALQEGEKSA